MQRQNLAYLYALITVFMWSTVASAFKLSLRYLNPILLLFYSSFVSLIVLLFIIILEGRYKKLFSAPCSVYKGAIILGFLNPFLYYGVLFMAYNLLPAQEAQPLNQTWVIVMAVLSAFILKQKLSGWVILSILISFLGVIIISTRGDLFTLNVQSPLGVTLALLSAIIWSLFWLYNVKIDADVEVKLILNFLFGFFYIALFVFLSGKFYLPSLRGMFWAAYVGVVEMGVTYVIWFRALSISKTTARISHMIYLVPPISLIFIHYYLGERIMYSTVLGLGLILTGILLHSYLIKGKDIAKINL